MSNHKDSPPIIFNEELKSRKMSEGKDELDYNTFKPQKADKYADILSEFSYKSRQTTYSVTKPNSESSHALFNFTKSFIGIGALTIASAMKNAGIFLGLFGIITVGFLCLYGVNIMVLTRRKILKDRSMSEARNNYLPQILDNDNDNDVPHESDNDESLEELRLRGSGDSRTFTDRVLQENHNIKTYADLGQEVYGSIGYYSVITLIFIQQLTIVTAYFFFLDRYFPSYLVLIGIAPI